MVYYYMIVKLKSSLIIKDFLNIIENATGLNICLYDFENFSKKDEKLRLGNESFCHTRPYCLAIKTSKKAHNICIASEHGIRSELLKINKPVWRTCHAGLSEIVIPVYIKEKYICSIHAGQVFFKKMSEKEITIKAAYFEKLGVDRELIIKSIKDVPIITRAHINQSLNLISMLINFIVETGEKLDWQDELNKIKESYNKTSLPELSNKLDYLMKSVKQIRNIKYKNIVEKVMNVLKTKATDNINLSEISREVGFSRFYLSRIFKAETGKSFRNYIIDLRLETAKKHMKDDDLNLTDIAYKCGYQDLSSFTRSFKKAAGLTPGKYRILNSKN
ncbi:MAG: hypothetical protein A2231_08640 [Candidatus Firestonebacteria bacterium RIFOXYA2_FULL_40_8]|nr:MAG: hypothetical protein A2231_08640 [Candidatus Firestonebacteria bacterium RIFOXYA2_FULL_40_8]